MKNIKKYFIELPYRGPTSRVPARDGSPINALHFFVLFTTFSSSYHFRFYFRAWSLFACVLFQFSWFLVCGVPGGPKTPAEAGAQTSVRVESA